MSNNLFEDTILYIREQQDETDQLPEETEEDQTEETPPSNMMPQTTPQQYTTSGIGQSNSDMGMDGVTGMGTGSEEEEDPEVKIEKVSKAYILKKIYSRLLGISKVLDNLNENEAVELKKEILETLDLFHLIVENYKYFFEVIDEIINLFQKILSEATEKLETLLKSSK